MKQSAPPISLRSTGEFLSQCRSRNAPARAARRTGRGLSCIRAGAVRLDDRNVFGIETIPNPQKNDDR